MLTEGDDQQDPIADASRAILDGHIVLSRSLADSGHYPAIDIEASISRVAPMVISNEHLEAMRRVKQTYSLYQQNRDLISIGAYAQGSDPRIDNAIRLQPAMNAFCAKPCVMHLALPIAKSCLGNLLHSANNGVIELIEV